MAKTLTNQLFNEVPKMDRCPNLKKDVMSAYCSRDLNRGEEIPTARRDLCTPESLQEYCLNKCGYKECVFYHPEDFR